MLDYFLDRKIKAGLKKYNRSGRSFLKYTEIEKILIIFNEEDWSNILPVIETLNQDQKEVIAWTIKTKQEQPHQFSHYVRVIDPDKDINWLNLFRDELLEEYNQLSYDTLLDLTSKGDNHLSLLVTENKSRFSISFSDKGLKLYDFILLKEDDKSFLEAFHSLKNYLTLI